MPFGLIGTTALVDAETFPESIWAFSSFGCVFGLELSVIWTFFLASGLAGALTTFSTMNKELIELWGNGQKQKALLYVFITYCGGIVLALSGYYLGLYF